MPTKFRVLLALTFLLVFCVAGVRSQLVPATDGDARSFMHGDGPTDQNTLSAIHYFYDRGFWASSFRPIHGYQPMLSDGEAYTHSPSLPDVLWAWGAKQFGSYDESKARIFPIAVSALWFVLIFLFFHQVLPNSKAAFLSSLILVSSSYFVLWADGLHKGVLEELFRLLYVWALFYYYQHRSRVSNFKRWSLIAALATLAVLIANTSLETVPFCAVFTVALSCFYEKSWKKVLSPMTVGLGVSFVLGFGFHLFMNSLYFGGWNLALEDILKAGSFRTGTCGDEAKCGVSFTELLMAPISFINRLERHFLIPGWAALFFGYWAFRHFKKTNTDLYKLTWAVLLATPAWFFLMPQHALVHHFVARNWGLIYGLVIGTGLFLYQEILRSHLRQRKMACLALDFIFIFYCVAMMITQQLIPIYWKYSFAYLF